MGVNGNKEMGINKTDNSIFKDNGYGLVVQLGKTSPSRGEDRRFKSGPAHFMAFYASFCCARAQKGLLNMII
jgi:hypothetical protein